MDRSLYLTRLRDARRAGLITPAAFLIGLELLRYAGRAGTCWPSLARLADGAGLSVRTVSRAIAVLRDIGALTWRHRPGVAWNRAASNAYTLLTPPKQSISLGIRSVATVSNSSAPSLMGPALIAALARLGAAMGGIPADQVMPWLDIETGKLLPTAQLVP